jgi:hypothetical protein
MCVYVFYVCVPSHLPVCDQAGEGLAAVRDGVLTNGEHGHKRLCCKGAGLRLRSGLAHLHIMRMYVWVCMCDVEYVRAAARASVLV